MIYKDANGKELIIGGLYETRCPQYYELVLIINIDKTENQIEVWKFDRRDPQTDDRWCAGLFKDYKMVEYE